MSRVKLLSTCNHGFDSFKSLLGKDVVFELLIVISMYPLPLGYTIKTKIKVERGMIRHSDNHSIQRLKKKKRKR